MAEMMDVWAVTEFGKPLEKIQQPIPSPQSTEVVVKVTHSGVCHSDLHFWDGYWDLGSGKRINVADRGVKLPVAVGHEILGTVYKLGPDAGPAAEALLSPITIGQRRIVYPWLGCGKPECHPCELQQDNMCTAQRSLGIVQNGGFASYVLVPHPKYLVEAGELDPNVACTFGCSGITTLSACRKVMPVNPEEPVVLIGAGGLGLAAISMLRAMGHHNIVSVDVSDEKLEAASKAGARSVVNTAASQDSTKDILAVTGGSILNVIDFVNSSTTAPLVLSLLGKGAKWVQVGLMGGATELPLALMIFKAITIYGNLTGNVAHLNEVTRIAREGMLPPVPVTTMPWNKANDALQLLKDGKVTGRLILVAE
ncbi:hypothetical protein H2198_008577 [Neophaeococcomyces mojaviensis]|uniref:Uncharacterized protein n=1 Tax=Neophaeococcomyces mojaviensis TaxID=3383035 RepID=A0ACC2ZWT7_9EURO|nr:hypothetical protein H2198_008577 [Knufia sp. JES_112]